MLTGKSSITYHLGQCDAEDLGCEEVLVNSFSMLAKKALMMESGHQLQCQLAMQIEPVQISISVE